MNLYIFINFLFTCFASVFCLIPTTPSLVIGNLSAQNATGIFPLCSNLCFQFDYLLFI